MHYIKLWCARCFEYCIKLANLNDLQIEELEGELVSVVKECTEASTKYKNIATAVVNHDDRANLLQFKLQGMCFYKFGQFKKQETNL